MPFLAPVGAAVVGSTAAAGASTAALATIGTLAVGGIGFLGSQLFKSPDTPSAPSALPTAPTQAAATEKSRADAVAEQRERLRGSKTTLTSPQGLLAPVQVTGKTLLGA